MKIKPIIFIAGEPNSVFLEIFFKVSKKLWFKKFSRPIILIALKKINSRSNEKIGI